MTEQKSVLTGHFQMLEATDHSLVTMPVGCSSRLTILRRLMHLHRHLLLLMAVVQLLPVFLRTRHALLTVTLMMLTSCLLLELLIHVEAFISIVEDLFPNLLRVVKRVVLTEVTRIT